MPVSKKSRSRKETVPAAPIEVLLSQAVDHHRRGQLPEAERLYGAVLARQPKQSDANHNLGVLLTQRGDMAQAVPLFQAAVRQTPTALQYWLSYIDVLLQNERPREARIAVSEAKAAGHSSVSFSALEARLFPHEQPAMQYEVVGAFTQGDYQHAEMVARKMTEELPEAGFGWKALGAAIKMQGRLAEALEPTRQAVALSPDDAEARSNLGSILEDQEETEEAERHLRVALILSPDFGNALNNQAACLRQLKQEHLAERICRRAIRLNPGSAEAYNNLGNALQEQDLFDQALTNFHRAISLSPGYSLAYSNMAVIYKEQEQDAVLERACRRAFTLDPFNVDARNNLGSLQKETGDLSLAAENFVLSVAIKPDYADAYNNIANVSQNFGKMAAAKAGYRRALTVRPDFPQCLHNLVHIKKFTKDDPDLALLETLYPGAEGEDRKYLAFALGKAYADVKDYDKSFACLQEANTLHRQTLNYTIQEDRDLTSFLEAAFDRLPDVEPIRAGAARPILIVGMPRSGTSLTEQILASHSSVYGAGELETLNRLVGKYFPHDPASQLAESCRRISQEYGDQIDSLRQGKSVVTDKMPRNFAWLGFILQARPDIKVIHSLRDPRAVCLSNYQRLFAAKGLQFTYDLADLATYYRLHEELMQFWRERFPGRIYTLSYESLTENQEEETRHLLDFCELEFEPACLEFEKTEREVKTASSAQVREKIYKGSSEAWRRYGDHLAPLLDGLGLPADREWTGLLPAASEPRDLKKMGRQE